MSSVQLNGFTIFVCDFTKIFNYFLYSNVGVRDLLFKTVLYGSCSE